MKRTLFLAVLAGVALAGCVKNEPIAKGDGSPERITFAAPVVSVPTRATEIYGNYPKDKDFAVYAIYHTESFAEGSDGTFAGLTAAPATSSMFMTNVKCTAKKDDWSAVVGNETPAFWAPDAAYYWPKGGKLTFGAYAPSMTNTETGAQKVEWGANGFKFNDFKVDDTPANQFDLLYSDFVKDQTSSSMVTDEPYDGITIPFQHALSSIVFKASSPDISGNVESITITDLTVKNIASTGDFVQKGTTPWTVDWTTLNEYHVLSNGEVSLSANVKEVLDALDGTDETYGSQNPPSTPNGPGDNGVTINNDGKRRSDLILIPQNLKGGTDGRGEDIAAAKIYIKYNIKYKGGAIDTNEIDRELAVGETDKWEMGKRYIYTITIGLNKIYFNPTVQNWTDVNAPAITI